MQESKRQAHQLSFDDLLRDLDGALGSGLGERLCERIRATYRVAMIDEFRIPTPSSTASSIAFTAVTRTRRS
jgi:exodeoxyribonuclease V beta subunit